MELERQLHDAYISDRVTIHYRWHALQGVPLQCRRRHGPTYLECELPDGTSALVPTWMIDAVACARFSSGAPLVSLEALEHLRTLLDSLRSDRNGNMSTRGSKSKKEKSVVGNDVVIVGEFFVADCTFPVLFHDLPIQKLSHLCW